jgi:hypothetical protein
MVLCAVRFLLCLLCMTCVRDLTVCELLRHVSLGQDHAELLTCVGYREPSILDSLLGEDARKAAFEILCAVVEARRDCATSAYLRRNNFHGGR